MEDSRVKSTQKVDELLAERLDPEQLAQKAPALAQYLAMAQGFGVDVAGVARAHLPDDPEQLDDVLLQLAAHALRARSDDAPMLAIAVHEGRVISLRTADVDGKVTEHAGPRPGVIEPAVDEPEPEPAGDAGETS
jgi:hypothetical protein